MSSDRSTSSDFPATSVCGIVVPIKYVQEAYEQEKAAQYYGNKSDPIEVEEMPEEEGRDDNRLTNEAKEWLIRKAANFDLKTLIKYFIITHAGETWESEVDCAYENSSCQKPSVRVIPGNVNSDKIAAELVEMSCSITPMGRKLASPPGEIHIHGVVCKEYHKGTPKSSTSSEFVPVLEQDDLPADLTITVGSGSEQKVYNTNSSVLVYYVPGFGRVLEASGSTKAIELPKLSPVKFETVINHFTTRDSVASVLDDNYDYFGDYFGDYDGDHNSCCNGYEMKVAIQNVERHFHRFVVFGKEPKSYDHPMTTFLVGPDKTPVIAHRAILAAMNPILKKMLYGTGMITVDQSKPIEWPDVDDQVVPVVIRAIENRGKCPRILPFELRNPLDQFLDYIGETKASTNIVVDL